MFSKSVRITPTGVTASAEALRTSSTREEFFAVPNFPSKRDLANRLLFADAKCFDKNQVVRVEATTELVDLVDEFGLVFHRITDDLSVICNDASPRTNVAV